MGLSTCLRAAAAALIAALLCGCAAQSAFREGQKLVQRGEPLAGLAKFEEANRLDPQAAQYRMAVIQTRERYLDSGLARAEALRSAGELDAAEQALRSLLPLGARDERVGAALRALERERRATALLGEAQAAVDKKDLERARAHLRTILLESPTHEGAGRLARKLELEAVKPPPETELAAAYRQPITIEFKDAALRSVFDVISRTSGLNFIFDRDVRTDQKTSIFLKNSTIEAAVRLTLLTNQLGQRVLDGNTVLIYPNTQAKQREYQPLSVRGFYLANADAKTVAATLKSLLRVRDVVVDEKLNLMIVRDSPETIRMAEKLVALHDLPEAEVMLEVEVLEIERSNLLDLGIRWPDQVTLSPLAAAGGAGLTLAELRNLNSSRIGASVGNITITARETESDANILANPRIRVRNREKAKVLIGTRVPNITTVITATGFSSESINYVDVGLKLEVEPTIYLDSEVAIKVSLEVSNIISQLQTSSGSVAFQIGARTAQTVLRLKDGENQVLAGLINDEDRRSATKIPLLGDVPLLGRLFGSHADKSTKNEIVLSITPRIVRNVRRPEAHQLEFETGTESSMGTGAPAPSSSSGPPRSTPSGAPLPVRPSSPGSPGPAPGGPPPAGVFVPGTSGPTEVGPAPPQEGQARPAPRPDLLSPPPPPLRSQP